jgi:hypothetical protein
MNENLKTFILNKQEKLEEIDKDIEEEYTKNNF